MLRCAGVNKLLEQRKEVMKGLSVPPVSRAHLNAHAYFTQLDHLLKMNRLVTLLIVGLVGTAELPGCLADISEDIVTSLPGWSGPTLTGQYSGYINVSDTKHLHYWFVVSSNKPESDPVVLWLNGGPGCSSLMGYFTEMGPLHFNRESADNLPLPQLLYNKYTWTNISNMIFLESPVGVGFSYSDNPDVDYNIDDNQTALDNYHFLVEFFRYFPEYRNNDFYIAGESYGGIYVPTLVDTIRNMNQKSTSDALNLKGLMVGNGCVGIEVGACGALSGLKIRVDYYHGHGLFSDPLYEDILKHCDFVDLSDKCKNLLLEMSDEIGRLNIYDIYSPCYKNTGSTSEYARDPLKDLLLERAGRYAGPEACIDDHIERKYLDNATVREAMHVASVERIGGWKVCSDKINYTLNTPSLLPMYPTLISKYRTLIFNGDFDACVPYISDEQWTSGVGFETKNGWRPWTVFDQVAGYVTEYEENDFTFLTVKGAGHQVPVLKPMISWVMFSRYINKLPF